MRLPESLWKTWIAERQGSVARDVFRSGEDDHLLCGKQKEIVKLKELVDDIDPNAFVIVSDAREVHGEGFIEKN